MKIVTYRGAVYELHNDSFKRLLKVIGRGESFDMNDYGKPLGPLLNITDLRPNQVASVLAQFELDLGKAREQRKRWHALIVKKLMEKK